MIDLSNWLIEDYVVVKLGGDWGSYSKKGYAMIGLDDAGNMLLIKGQPKEKTTFTIAFSKTTQNKWGDYIKYSMSREHRDIATKEQVKQEITDDVERWIRQKVAQ